MVFLLVFMISLIQAPHIGVEWSASLGVTILASILFLLIFYVGVKLAKRYFDKKYGYADEKSRSHYKPIPQTDDPTPK